MPEEYRIWKEKIDAIEKKVEEKKSSESSTKNNSSGKISDEAPNGSHSSTSEKRNNANNAHPVLPTYSSPEEAKQAFFELLNDKQVSVSAKMKEIQDLCQSDPRWLALRTQGEKKQALAEYQVR